MRSIQNEIPEDIRKFTYIIKSFILNTPHKNFFRSVVFENSNILTRWTGPKFYSRNPVIFLRILWSFEKLDILLVLGKLAGVGASI